VGLNQSVEFTRRKGYPFGRNNCFLLRDAAPVPSKALAPQQCPKAHHGCGGSLLAVIAIATFRFDHFCFEGIKQFNEAIFERGQALNFELIGDIVKINAQVCQLI